jgi:recombination protein RecA
MPAASEVEALRALLREQGLGAALPAVARKDDPPASTGFPVLDALLDGGVPRGQITELVGPASSGRTSVAFAILAEATARGEVAAYIDASDCLDPRSAQGAGIALERLLWVRVATGAPACPPQSVVAGNLPHGTAVRLGTTSRRPASAEAISTCQGPIVDAPRLDGAGETPNSRRVASADRRERLSPPAHAVRPSRKNNPAWQAVNLVASAGGFGVIVLDLGGVKKHMLREWQSRQWLRLRRAIEHSPTALILLASHHLASTVSALVLEFAREKTRWVGAPGISLLLEGTATRIRIGQQRKSTKVRAQDCRLEIFG